MRFKTFQSFQELLKAQKGLGTIPEKILKAVLMPQLLKCKSYVVMDVANIRSWGTFSGNARRGDGSSGTKTQDQTYILSIYDIHTIFVLCGDFEAYGGISSYDRMTWDESMKRDCQ